MRQETWRQCRDVFFGAWLVIVVVRELSREFAHSLMHLTTAARTWWAWGGSGTKSACSGLFSKTSQCNNEMTSGDNQRQLQLQSYLDISCVASELKKMWMRGAREQWFISVWVKSSCRLIFQVVTCTTTSFPWIYPRWHERRQETGWKWWNLKATLRDSCIISNYVLVSLGLKD